jgi:5-methylcytosine-specific restriction endonuclease McrA
MTDFTRLPVLVLNPDFTPMEIFPRLGTIPGKDAVPKILAGSCYSVSDYPERVAHPTLNMHWPSVIVRKEFDSWARHPRLTRELLWYRDNMSCQYCGVELESYKQVSFDHVVPKRDGGKKEWMNIVSSCSACNQKKGHKAPIGQWKPRSTPHTPNFWQLLSLRKKHPLVIHHESWRDFLPDWEGGIKLVSL